MKEIILVVAKSIKNNLRFKALIIVYLAITLMIAAGLALFFSVLMIGPEVKKVSPNLELLNVSVGLIMYTICFVSLGINMNIFAYQSMVKEKALGNIESLLATPMSIKNMWIGKSLAVFIPGMILGQVLAVASLVAINYIYLAPTVGFIYNHWMGLNSLLVLPCIYLALSFLSHLIGFSGKAASGNIINQLFLPIGLTLMINLMTRGVLDSASWPFAAANLGLAAVLGIIVVLLHSHLTIERVILSSKEK